MGMVAHEMMHLAVFAALGHNATLETASWRLQLFGLHLFTVHAAALAECRWRIRLWTTRWVR